MKKIRPLLLLIYILGGLTFFSLSCNRKKIPPSENYTLLITLKDDLSSKYISTNYQTYFATDINKSNKTLNQYQVHFSCNDASFKKLQEELANDASILNFSNQKSNNNIQSGKNEEHGKSKPIRDKN